MVMERMMGMKHVERRMEQRMERAELRGVNIIFGMGSSPVDEVSDEE